MADLLKFLQENSSCDMTIQEVAKDPRTTLKKLQTSLASIKVNALGSAFRKTMDKTAILETY